MDPMKKTLIAAAALLTATAAVAQVGVPARPQAPRDGIQTRAEAVQHVRTLFTQVDANRDGVLTQAEAQSMRGQARVQRGARAADPARRQAMFERLDANRDNVVSRDEWTRAEAQRGQRQAARGERGARGARMAMRGGMGGGMLRRADLNNDQRVTLQEAESAALQRFDRVDLNRDGRITPDERQQRRQQRQVRG